MFRILYLFDGNEKGKHIQFFKNQSKSGKKTLCIHWITTELDWNWGTITSLWSICPKSKSWKWFQTLKYVCTMFFLRCFKNSEARRRVASCTATVIKFSWRSVGNSCSWISLLDPQGCEVLYFFEGQKQHSYLVDHSFVISYDA